MENSENARDGHDVLKIEKDSRSEAARLIADESQGARAGDVLIQGSGRWPKNKIWIRCFGFQNKTKASKKFTNISETLPLRPPPPPP